MAAPTFATGDVPSATQVNQWFVNVGFVRKQSTASITNNTTVADDADLTLGVSASTVYELTALIFYDGATASDLKTGWSVPAGATLAWAGGGLTVPAGLFSDDQVFSGTEASSAIFGALGTGTTSVLSIRGLLVVSSTAGNLTFRWAQGTAGATATRLFANSYLCLRRAA